MVLGGLTEIRKMKVKRKEIKDLYKFFESTLLLNIKLHTVYDLMFKKPKMDTKEYMKQYRIKNKEKRRKYDQDRYYSDRENQIKRVRDWEKRNPEKYRAMMVKRSKRYYHTHPKEMKEYKRKYIINNREKVNARAQAHKLHLKLDRCLICNLNEDLDFHHTDYGSQQGFTACGEHHQEQTNLLKQFPY